MIKFTSFLPKISPIAGYYLQFLTQSGKFSLFFLSPHSYAKVSIIQIPLKKTQWLTMIVQVVNMPKKPSKSFITIIPKRRLFYGIKN